MKTDRELLELAAKAAGIIGVWHERGQCIHVTGRAGMSDMWWRPLEDDGDVARLEAALEIDVAWMSRTVTSQHLSGGVLCSVSESLAAHDMDRAKSRRYASVRVAAAIWESMK